MIFVIWTAVAWLVGGGIVVATALPLSKSVRWWVRAWEFPRLHIAVSGLVLLGLLVVWPVASGVVLGLLVFGSAFYQLLRIWPYTRFARNEIDIVTGVSKDKQVHLLSANVLMENADKSRLIDIINAQDPDVLFLMETDDSWCDALKGCLDRYPTVLAQPQDNHYGLIFATRLKVQKADITFLSDDNTPSIVAELLGPDGTGFNFIGLHPRPPVPGNDTELRDTQIKRAAAQTNEANWPTICMGDFNDVAWSWTSRRFKKLGAYFEPRVGRGMYSTFHAQHRLLRVPIDQIYMTRGIALVSFGRLADFGSDHFPISVVVSVDPGVMSANPGVMG